MSTEPTELDERRQRAIEEAGIQFPMASLDSMPLDYFAWEAPEPGSKEALDRRLFSIAIVDSAGFLHRVVDSGHAYAVANFLGPLVGFKAADVVDFIEYAALDVGENTIEIGRAQFERAGLPMRIVIRRIK